MALLTDGNPNDTEALRVFETEILSVARVETIDLLAKLDLATREVSYEVIDILLDRAADPRAGLRRVLGVSDVVVTPQMRRWHALHTLKVVYRDAYNNQLNDRYRKKWQEYRFLSGEAREQTVHFGIGLVSQPIPRGSLPVFSSLPALSPSTVYYVQMNWVAASGQQGSPSLMTTFQTPEGSTLVVEAGTAPAGATGWNVFVGLTDTNITQQNLAPLALAGSFVIPETGLIAGPAPSEGQVPDTFVTAGRTVRRG